VKECSLSRFSGGPPARGWVLEDALDKGRGGNGRGVEALFRWVVESSEGGVGRWERCDGHVVIAIDGFLNWLRRVDVTTLD
jgi:hypothetical protein